ncbi:MAG: thioesterase domain-containing protein, partial [Xenococcaceae cyanobacterium]
HFEDLHPEAIGTAIARYQISTIYLPVRLFNYLVEKQLQNLRSIRQLLTGGDLISSYHVRKFLQQPSVGEAVVSRFPRHLVRRANGHSPLQNHSPLLTYVYSHTENTVPACYLPIAEPPLPETTIAIGKPTANTKVYILDKYLQPVPVGIVGELYIGGEGLAQGYFNRPDLTEEKFIIPSKNVSATRLYKTGDLARYLPDGNIEFFGRQSDRITINGFSINPTEIERILLKHSSVKEAVAIVRKDLPGENHLVAYLVVDCEIFNSETIRSFLKQQLPDYAIPSAFVILDSLPLNAHGKLDRQALPLVSQHDSETFIAPRNGIEAQLAKIWSQVLGIKKIGIKDNFFDLGGNSLLAFRLFSQIEDEFAKKLPLATLFQAQTIEAIAKILDRKQQSFSWSSLVPIQTGGSKPALFCIHAVGGNVISYRGLARYLGEARSVYGLQVKGLNGQEQLYETVEEMAAYYLQEILALQSEGPYHLGGHSFGGYVALEMAQQLKRRGKQVGLLAMFDCIGPNFVDKINTSTRIRIHLNNLAASNFEEKLDYLRSRTQLLVADKIPKPITQTYLKFTDKFRSPQEILIRQIEQTNTIALRKYLPQVPVYPGKITLFQATVRATEGYFDPLGGWGQIAANGVQIHPIPGDHASFLLKESNLQVFAKKLKDCLDKED